MKNALIIILTVVGVIVLGIVLTILPVALIMYLLSLANIIEFSWLWVFIISLGISLLRSIFTVHVS